MERRAKPDVRPKNPSFSSGPCAKRPGWSPQCLQHALVGRSHRSSEGRTRLKSAIDKTVALLGLPAGYRAAIVPGSDTGAFEMAMWNLLGARGADVFAWEVFGRIWLRDAVAELKLPDLRTFDADWGHLPDLARADFNRDILFAWNGTTTGVRVPNADWIPDDRAGLVMCDATSAIFAQDIAFSKIDVLTYSWQKALGGEGAHGILILSPRAFERLRTYTPTWPIPKILRLSRAAQASDDVFEGVTINTPSMLCVEDYLDALAWVEDVGGLSGTIARSDANAKVVYDWIARTPWVAPLAKDPATLSNTSICLRYTGADGREPSDEIALKKTKAMCELLAKENAAFDIASYRGVPAGFRIWTGATIESSDVKALTAWIDWAHDEVEAQRGA